MYPGLIQLLALATAALIALAAASAAHAAGANDPASRPAGDGELATLRARLAAAAIPTDAGELDRLHRTAAAALASLQPDGSWADVEYADQRAAQWRAREHLSRLVLLARSYRATRDARGDDAAADLHTAATRALGYWLDRDPQNPNWWFNQIGVPQLIGETLILLGDAALPDHVARGAALMRRSAWGKWTGQNLVWGVTIQIVRGCLDDAPDVVAEGYARLYREVEVVPPGREGIQADLSFHQHGPQLYSGGYGLGFANDVGRYVALAWGTRFAPPPEPLDVLIAYLLDGQQWMVRGGVFDYSAVGREITRKGKSAGGLKNTVARLAALPGVPRRDELVAFAARLRGDPSAPPLIGHRHFWRSDYAAHHRPGYFASVRMFSDRLLNTETVNGEGRTSHHLADGTMLLYRTGGEYKDIFPVWDWNKVPGTTAEQVELKPEPKGTGIKGKTHFVGGASDGACGAAAMDLERGSLTARKAWLFFDDAIVCLGAGITCSTDNAVVTSINQCLLNRSVTTSEPTQPLPQGSYELNGIGWVHHDGVAYLFPQPADVRVGNRPQTGRWSDIGAGSDEPVTVPVFSLWLDHGARVANGGYAYLVRPDVTPAQAGASLDDLNVRILSNTPALQAAASPQRVSAVFWEPGEVDAGDGRRAGVDQPCVLLLKQEPGGAHVTVANPRNEALCVRVRVAGADPVEIDLPGGARAGSSVTRYIPLKPTEPAR